MMIRELRRQCGMTQAELAKKLSIAPNTLSQYETGRNRLDAETAKKIADIFGVSLDDIYGYKAPTRPAKQDPLVKDEFVGFYGDVKENLTEDDLDDIRTLMKLRAELNRSKKE